MSNAHSNARQIQPSNVAGTITPEKGVCLCGHDGLQHGTTGACRFGTTHGCTTFTSKER